MNQHQINALAKKAKAKAQKEKKEKPVEKKPTVQKRSPKISMAVLFEGKQVLNIEYMNLQNLKTTWHNAITLKQEVVMLNSQIKKTKILVTKATELPEFKLRFFSMGGSYTFAEMEKIISKTTFQTVLLNPDVPVSIQKSQLSEQHLQPMAQIVYVRNIDATSPGAASKLDRLKSFIQEGVTIVNE